MRLLERYVRTRDALSQINGVSAGEENNDWRPSSLFWQVYCLLGSATTPLQYCGNTAVLVVIFTDVSGELSVPSLWVKKPTRQEGSLRLSRNVGKKLPLPTA